MTSFTIDAQDRDWTASLEILDANRAVISGPHDISDALISVDIDFSELRSGNRLNGWLAWEGSIVLSPELSPQQLVLITAILPLTRQVLKSWPWETGSH